jgi:hypothetical protein
VRATFGALLSVLALASLGLSALVPIDSAYGRPNSVRPRRAPVPPANPDLVDVPVADYRVGVDLGALVPTDATFGGSRAILGADFYFVESDAFDLGISYLTGGARVEATRKRWRMNFVGVELNDKLPNVAAGFYVGASAGVASFDGGDAFLPGFDHFFFGPKLGVLRMISRSFSVGLEGKVLLVTSDPLVVAIEGLGSLHYHF